MRNALILLVVTSFLGAQSAIASDVDIDLVCPLTVPAGGSVNVIVSLKNDGCSAFDFQRTFVAIAGNTDDSVGGLGIFGPFVRAISGTIPEAECNFGFPVFPEVPGELGPLLVNVTNNVPASLVGTAAGMFVSLDATETDSTGETEKTLISGSCIVEITAP